MRNLVAGSLVAAALSFGLAGMPVLAADADPTVQQIYEAARAGHFDQAQAMMSQVLRDHPESSKAHYVQSELYAREGNLSSARSEFARAEQLDPGLTKENPHSVQELKAELGVRNAGALGGMTGAGGIGTATSTSFPWRTVVILALVAGGFWMLFRRRRTYVQYPAGGAPGAYGPGGYAGPGPGGYAGPAGGMGGGGVGSNIAGGLAGGLAAGAGIVAGEELAHHFLDGGRQVPPPAGDDNSWGSGANPNTDMGGSDFGVNDPGSWDDGSSGGGDLGGGGGGGDDWT